MKNYIILVEHFLGKKECSDIEELKSVLKIRNSKESNEFIITTMKEYPFLTLTVKEAFALLHYFENGDGSVYIAIGKNNSLDPNGNTVFYSCTQTQEIQMDNLFVLNISDAQTAAEEFFGNHETLPKSVSWEPLCIK